MKILIFGASGSAGGSVLRACLASTSVEEVRTITRRALSLVNTKLREYIHNDYLNYTGVESAFEDVEACFFCLGISVTQVSGEAEYRKITYDFAIAAASVLRERSPKAAFHFISGQGTNVNSRFMWARMKAEAENDLMANFDAVCWRPAAIDGERPASQPFVYRVTRFVFPLLRPFRSLYVSGADLGRAMLLATKEKMRRRIIENKEIRDLADRAVP
jgi:uncharacterized protein YbjT (DUF2867 family)